MMGRCLLEPPRDLLLPLLPLPSLSYRGFPSKSAGDARCQAVLSTLSKPMVTLT